MAVADPSELLRSAARQVLGRAELSRSDKVATGWCGMLTDEVLGGSGWNPAEACVIAEETGAARSPWHWAGTALAAAALGSCPATQALAKSVMAGERTAIYGLADLAPSPGPGQASGSVRWAIGGPADLVVVSTPDDAVLLVLDEDTNLRWIEPAAVIDTARTTHHLRFCGSATTLASSGIDDLNAMAVLLACADALGTLSAAAEIVRSHLAERTAFGAPLASFQVLQHRLVELDLLTRAGRALIRRAGAVLGACAPTCPTVDAAHAYLAPRLSSALSDCIQLAGGMGFAWEFPLHHGLRRTATTFASVRSVESSRRRLIRARGWSTEP
jgi:alkylation response protein AidB-like acyl-CoA dehydrogenase